MIIVDTGCVQFDNLKRSKRIVSEIYRVTDRLFKVSFESGLTCRFNANTDHLVVE